MGVISAEAGVISTKAGDLVAPLPFRARTYTAGRMATGVIGKAEGAANTIGGQGPPTEGMYGPLALGPVGGQTRKDKQSKSGVRSSTPPKQRMEPK